MVPTSKNAWFKRREILEEEKTVQNAVPEATVELVRCECKKGCKTNACGFKKGGLTCTDVCICNEAQKMRKSK